MLAADVRHPYSMRLGEAEKYMLRAAAAERDEPLSVYIRRRALEAARRDLRREADILTGDDREGR